MQDLSTISLSVIASRLRNKELQSEALAEWVIANHDLYDSGLAAYKSWSPEKTLAQARAADQLAQAGRRLAPLHGIPISVKDLIGVAGYPIFAGSPRRLPDEWESEGPVVQSIRSQLGVITGKTHTTEFAFGALGTNKHWGTPRNPWDSTTFRVSGGSSSGAAVSLAERSALLALGTDSGGSIRMPAAATGAVGLKTSFGRWSTDCVVPLASSLDTVGFMARTVIDAIYGFAALDPRHYDPECFAARLEQQDLLGVRIGICENFMWESCSPSIVETVERALQKLVAEGARLIRFQWPESLDAYNLHIQGGVHSAEFAAFLRTRLPDWEATLDDIVQRRIGDGAAIQACEYIQRKNLISQLAQTTRRRFQAIDIIATPTIPITPPATADVKDVSDNIRLNRRMFQNTCVGNLLNMCAITIPAGLDAQSMPVGLQLFAPAMQEERLLGIARAAERSLGVSHELLGVPKMCSI